MIPMLSPSSQPCSGPTFGERNVAFGPGSAAGPPQCSRVGRAEAPSFREKRRRSCDSRCLYRSPRHWHHKPCALAPGFLILSFKARPGLRTRGVESVNTLRITHRSLPRPRPPLLTQMIPTLPCDRGERRAGPSGRSSPGASWRTRVHSDPDGRVAAQRPPAA